MPNDSDAILVARLARLALAYSPKFGDEMDKIGAERLARVIPALKDELSDHLGPNIYFAVFGQLRNLATLARQLPASLPAVEKSLTTLRSLWALALDHMPVEAQLICHDKLWSAAKSLGLPSHTLVGLHYELIAKDLVATRAPHEDKWRKEHLRLLAIAVPEVAEAGHIRPAASFQLQVVLFTNSEARNQAAVVRLHELLRKLSPDEAFEWFELGLESVDQQGAPEEAQLLAEQLSGHVQLAVGERRFLAEYKPIWEANGYVFADTEPSELDEVTVLQADAAARKRREGTRDWYAGVRETSDEIAEPLRIAAEHIRATESPRAAAQFVLSEMDHVTGAERGALLADAVAWATEGGDVVSAKRGLELFEAELSANADAASWRQLGDSYVDLASRRMGSAAENLRSAISRYETASRVFEAGGDPASAAECDLLKLQSQQALDAERPFSGEM